MFFISGANAMAVLTFLFKNITNVSSFDFDG